MWYNIIVCQNCKNTKGGLLKKFRFANISSTTINVVKTADTFATICLSKNINKSKLKVWVIIEFHITLKAWLGIPVFKYLKAHSLTVSSQIDILKSFKIIYNLFVVSQSFKFFVFNPLSPEGWCNYTPPWKNVFFISRFLKILKNISLQTVNQALIPNISYLLIHKLGFFEAILTDLQALF